MHYDAGMGVELLTTRHKDQIVGVLSCYDRIILLGFTTLDFFPLLIPRRYIARDDSITT